MPRTRGRKTVYSPNLHNILVTALACTLTSLVLLYAIFTTLEQWILPDYREKAELQRTLEAMKATLLIGATIGAVLTGVYAYRKQRLDEANEVRSDSQELSIRFSRAADQLGHSSAAVRLAGAFSLASLADEWREERQLCINVLTTYLQVPWPNKGLQGEVAVRRNIIRIIRDHLRPGFSAVSWADCHFRFEGAKFFGGDLTGIRLDGGTMTFHRSVFSSVTFHFDGLDVASGSLWFTKSDFAGGEVHFKNGRVRSKGYVNFEEAIVTGATVSFEGFKVDAGGQLKPGSFAGTISP